MQAKDSAPWWRSAVIYQIYIRSFAALNADGVGDIAGIRSRLPYQVGNHSFHADVGVAGSSRRRQLHIQKG